MQNQKTESISFIANPGLILDRILTIYVHEGREVAMKALSNAVREEIQAQTHALGDYTPRVLLWFVIGAEVSGDRSFHKREDFMKALALSFIEREQYKTAVAAIDLYISLTAGKH